jgi:hypothetical protein
VRLMLRQIRADGVIWHCGHQVVPILLGAVAGVPNGSRAPAHTAFFSKPLAVEVGHVPFLYDRQAGIRS